HARAERRSRGPGETRLHSRGRLPLLRVVQKLQARRRGPVGPLLQRFAAAARYLVLAAHLGQPANRLAEEQQGATDDERDTREAKLNGRVCAGAGQAATHAVGRATAAAGAVAGSRCSSSTRGTGS